MFRRFALVLLVLGAATAASAQIDPTTSKAVVNVPVCLMSCPAGDGNALGALGATVTFTVIDVTGAPVLGLTVRDFEIDGITPFAVADAYFPAGPAWDLVAGGFTVVGPGVYAFRGSLYAGGSEPAFAIGKARGVPLLGAPPMPITMVSPDLNADGVVNLADIPPFAAIFFGPYSFQADLNCDGTINLLDISILATHLGQAFPPGAVGDPVD